MQFFHAIRNRASGGLLCSVIFAAFMLAFGLRFAGGAWSEPLPGEVPDETTREAPVTASPIYQSRGKLAVKDLWIDDMQAWATELVQFKLLPQPLQFFGFFFYNPPGSANPDPGFSNWTTVTINPNAAPYANIMGAPSGATGRRIRAFSLQAFCGETYMWLFAPSPAEQNPPSVTTTAGAVNNATAAQHLACLGGNDDADTRTIVLPVYQQNPGDPFTFTYRLIATDSSDNTASAGLHLRGFYYTHEN